MKKALAVLGTVLGLGALAGIFYLGLHPEDHAEFLESIDALVLGQGEKLEVTPARTPAQAFAFPLSDEDLDAGFDPNYGDTVYTYFQDIGGDLWLPYRMEEDPLPVEKAFLCGEDGSLRWLDPDDCTGDSATGELRVSAEALADAPEGDCYLGVLCAAERERWYRLYYLSIHPECTFHSEDRGLATGGDDGSAVRFDRSAGTDGFTFHLYNLGDDRVTDVWKLEETITVSTEGGRNFHQKKLSDEDFTVSADGASVTLTQDYLNSLAALYPYYFRFGLGDRATLSSADMGEYGVALALADGPLTSTYVEGPAAYSLSGGGDYVFTIHLGGALGFYTEDGSTGLQFYDEAGDMDEGFPCPVAQAEMAADGTYVIPAAVLREAADRENTGFWLNVTFRLSDFYNEGKGYFVQLVE